MTVYHFVGIKGTGMSSLAQILHDMKHTVQGSDYESVSLHKQRWKSVVSRFFLLIKVM